jgi:hypothetical protein
MALRVVSVSGRSGDDCGEAVPSQQRRCPVSEGGVGTATGMKGSRRLKHVRVVRVAHPDD